MKWQGHNERHDWLAEHQLSALVLQLRNSVVLAQKKSVVPVHELVYVLAKEIANFIQKKNKALLCGSTLKQLRSTSFEWKNRLLPIQVGYRKPPFEKDITYLTDLTKHKIFSPLL